MTSLVRWLRNDVVESERNLSIDQWAEFFSFNGLDYPFIPRTTMGSNHEDIAPHFSGYVSGAYKNNGIIFACMTARALLFSEARFQFREIRKGRPGDLFGNRDLKILETPWANGTTGGLLARMIQDHDLAGNFYAIRTGNQLKRMRPDWVTIVLGSKIDAKTANWQYDAEVVGYLYHPGGMSAHQDPIAILADQVAHWSAITKDPLAQFRGESWLTPVIREITADNAATTHKLKFFENGATANMVVSLAPDIDPDTFQRWIELFEDGHEGVMNAYKTIYLGGGADVEVVGANMQQLDFKHTQGAGETRICAAARVPPVIVGVSEGLDAATYSNYGQARRAFADLTMRPLWRDACAALAPLLNVPPGTELWYDDRDISFLQEDQADAADIQQTQAVSIKTLIDAGYEPDSVVDAVVSSDFSRLKHSGLVSVQLLPPGMQAKPDNNNPTVTPAKKPATNGKSATPATTQK